MLSPSRGGRVGLCALAGGGNQLLNSIPPPLIPPQAGDTGRLQIVLKENINLALAKTQRREIYHLNK